MRCRSRRAFTLIELLVVIGILALLMTILFPILHRARAGARTSLCASNLRQLSHVLNLYLEFHDGYIPRRGQGDRKLARADRASDWFNALPLLLDGASYYALYTQGRRPRESDDHVLVCPAARDEGWIHFLPYGQNIFLSPWVRPSPHRISEIPRPANLVYLADSPSPYAATMPTAKPYSVEARHSGRANVIFLDSHVKTFDSDYLGCGSGDPHRDDVRWETESGGTNWTP